MIHNNKFFYSTSWMRSFQPYEICINVRELQEILKSKPMSKMCFNMGIRLQAYADYDKLKRAYKDIKKHYIDLWFYVS